MYMTPLSTFLSPTSNKPLISDTQAGLKGTLQVTQTSALMYISQHHRKMEPQSWEELQRAIVEHTASQALPLETLIEWVWGGAWNLHI